MIWELNFWKHMEHVKNINLIIYNFQTLDVIILLYGCARSKQKAS